MEGGKLIDVASEDAAMNVDSPSPREKEGSSSNRSGDKVESPEDEDESSEEISESAEDEKESSDDDPYGGSVYENLDSDEESMDGNPNGLLFVKRVKRFCEQYECDKLFSYEPHKLSRGTGFARVGGLRPVCRREMHHGYCKKIAKFAVKKYNEEQVLSEISPPEVLQRYFHFSLSILHFFLGGGFIYVWQKSHLEWINTVGHNIHTMNGLMHFLTIEAKDENGSKLYRAQVYDLKDTYILGFFKRAPESKRRNCETCGHTLRNSNVKKEAEMARSKHGSKHKARWTSDESSKEDNATRKLQRLAGYDEVSGGKGGEEESVPLGAL